MKGKTTNGKSEEQGYSYKNERTAMFTEKGQRLSKNRVRKRLVMNEEMPLHTDVRSGDGWNPDGVTPAEEEDILDVDSEWADWNGK